MKRYLVTVTATAAISVYTEVEVDDADDTMTSDEIEAEARSLAARADDWSLVDRDGWCLQDDMEDFDTSDPVEIEESGEESGS